jgi:hypothetical protein
VKHCQSSSDSLFKVFANRHEGSLNSALKPTGEPPFQMNCQFSEYRVEPLIPFYQCRVVFHESLAYFIFIVAADTRQKSHHLVLSPTRKGSHFVEYIL